MMNGTGKNAKILRRTSIIVDYKYTPVVLYYVG